MSPTPVVFSIYFSRTSRQLSESSCPNTSLVSPGLLPTSTYQSYLFLSMLISRQVVGVSLSKHLTCVSRTYSQPQPIEIFSMLISRQVVGVFTVQTPHLCLQDLLPTSACRDTPSISKHVISGNQLTSHLQQMTLQPTCHKNEVKQNTHHLNQEYSSSSMPLTLHQQCTNLVITSEP